MDGLRSRDELSKDIKSKGGRAEYMCSALVLSVSTQDANQGGGYYEILHTWAGSLSSDKSEGGQPSL